MKLEFFYFEECPYCQIVIRAIDQLKLRDRIEWHQIHQSKSSFDRLVKDTGRKTVPCLYIDNKPMHESRDIARWLEQNVTKILQK